MKYFNIYEKLPPDLAKFEDDRGTIIDLFYKRNINHVNQINSSPNSIRGNHKHEHTTQHVLIISGSLEYWYQNDQMASSSFVVGKPGDLFTSEPGEIHTFKIGSKGCEFITFSEGIRGGEDYESDTIRVESIIHEIL